MIDQHGSTRSDLEGWIRAHQEAPWRFLRLCGCPSEVADDLVQDALLAALHKRVHRQPDAVADAWLRGAVTNLWRMHLRSQRTRADALATFAADLALAEYAYVRCAARDGGAAWRAALAACMEQLPPAARETLNLRYEQGLSREEIGRRLGLQVDGVKASLRRARERLRRCIERRIATAGEGAQ